MNSKKFSEAMSELDSKYVDEAINYKKKSKKPIWIKWGAIAACLCLVVAGIAVSQIPNVFPDHGAGIDPGGTHPDGIDPVIASIAVYPATESIEDVANATVESIAEVDAYGFDTLGEYLPASLPDGYHFEKADLYETTMKDGTVILCSVCNIPQAMILHRETQERKLLLTPILLAIVWWSYFPYFLWRHLYWDFSRYSNYRRYSCSGRFHKVKEP